jgi:hypothetical protein
MFALYANPANPLPGFYCRCSTRHRQSRTTTILTVLQLFNDIVNIPEFREYLTHWRLA